MGVSLAVRFLNWWPHFQPDQSFVYQLLSRAVDDSLVVVDDRKAHVDIEAHSVFTSEGFLSPNSLLRLGAKLGLGSFHNWRLSNDYGIGALGPAGRYLWYTGENLRPPTGWDATLSFDLDSFSGTNFYLPHWAIRTTDLGWRDPNDPMSTGSSTLMSPRDSRPKPERFACLLASNPHPMRDRLVKELRSVGDVDLFGRAYDRPVQSKADLLSQYRYVICPENDLYPGYVTEKAIEAWVAQTVPIWWGLDPVGYLNPGAMVNAATTSVDGLAEFLIAVEEKPGAWEEIYCRPILRKRFDYEACIDFLRRQLTSVSR